MPPGHPPPKNLEVVSRGFAARARHRAFLKAVGAIDSCHIRIKCPSGLDGQCYRNRQFVTIRAVPSTRTWAGLGRCTIPGCSATAHCTDSQSTLLQGISSLQMDGTHASNIHSPIITRGQSKMEVRASVLKVEASVFLHGGTVTVCVYVSLEKLQIVRLTATIFLSISAIVEINVM